MRSHLRCCGVLFALAMNQLIGCGGLSKPYPDKSLHAIVVSDPPAATQAAANAVLRVDVVRVAEPYDATTFFYKMDATKFTSDYYNGFIAPPGRLLTGALVTYLAKSGVFSNVVGGSSMADNRYALETNVTALYGDYTPGQPKQAVIEARFFLIDESSGNYNVVFEKSYRQTAPLSSDAPGELADAFGKAYGDLLAALASDLRQVPLQPGAAQKSATR